MEDVVVSKGSKGIIAVRDQPKKWRCRINIYFDLAEYPVITKKRNDLLDFLNFLILHHLKPVYYYIQHEKIYNFFHLLTNADVEDDEATVEALMKKLSIISQSFVDYMLYLQSKEV